MAKKSIFEEIVNPQLGKIVPYLPGPMTQDIAAKYEMDPARGITSLPKYPISASLPKPSPKSFVVAAAS